MELGGVQKRSLLSAAEIIAENEDLLTEILLRVPAGPLIRFQCVSERWLSIISAPDFRRRHNLHHPTPKVSAVLLRHTNAGFRYLSLSLTATNPSPIPFEIPKFFNDPLDILQSCNGLLLCSTLEEDDETQFRRNYFVYNPTTTRFRLLPLPEKSVAVLGMNLAFDPTRSPYYLVVCVQTTVQSSYYYQIMVYSNSGSSEAWRPCGSPFVAPHDMCFGRGVYWNGAIHWFSMRGASLCFDLARECFVNMPSVPRIGGFAVAAVSCGHLHLVETPRPRLNAELRVFRLESDRSCFVEYGVEITRLAAAFPQMVWGGHGHRHGGLDPSRCAFSVLSVVGLGGDGEGESSLLLHVPGKIIAYDLEEKTFREICNLSPGQNLEFGCSDAYDYVETLACV